MHLYGLYLDLYLWDLPHYRAKSYRHDLLAVRVGVNLLYVYGRDESDFLRC